MSGNNLILILVAVFNVFFAYFIIKKNKKNVTNQTFAIFVLLLGLWSASVVILNIVKSVSIGNIVVGLGLSMGAIFPLFAKTYPSSKTKPSLIFYLPFLIPIVIYFILAPFGLILNEVKIHDDSLEPIFSPLYPLMVVYAVIITIYGFISLVKRYRKSVGVEKLQMKYLFIGVFLFFTTIITFNVILPVFGIYQLIIFGPLTSVFFVGFTSYAIIRHRLMDIRLIVKRSLVVFSSYVFIVLFVWGLMIGVGRLIGRSPDPKLTIAGLASVIFALSIYLFVRRFFEKLANKYFFTSLYNYQATLEELATKLTAVIEMPKVIDLIVETIMKTMGLDRAGVLSLSNERNANRYIIAKVIGFNEQNGISLVRDNFLVQWLTNNRKMVAYEELDWMIEESQGNGARSSLMRLKANMNKIEASLCVPLMSQDKLISIIVLGNKVTGDAYTVEDFRLLQTISNQASVAIENARLYQQVQDFNKNLQTKVNEQTQDIKNKNLRLEKLLQIRSEFLDIASHQLRTPVSMIRGVLSMIRDGDLKKLPKSKQAQFIENAWQKGAKLDTIINDILAASELDTQKFQVDLETPKIQLEDVTDQVVKGFQLEAEERGIEFKWSKPSHPLLKVKGHANFLEQALNNLVGNALKYTPSTRMAKEARSQRKTKGVVEVGISQVKNDIVFKVSDNGIGIPKVEIKKLFDKFVRASNATAMYTDGSGLGLFIVKEIIEGHRGKVWVESIENKGSTFYISLPVVSG